MANPPRLLVAGVAWPLETFLERLLCGLAAKGFRITIASEVRPAQSWLDETGIEWMHASLWRGMGIAPLVRLVSHSLRVLLLARRDGGTLWRAAESGGDWKSRLAGWYLLAPFAGRRWDFVYFPWNFAAATFLPLFDLGMPVLVSCRGSQVNIAPTNPRRAGLLPALSETFERAARVHCVSRDILQDAQKLGLDLVKAQVIYPAVDANFFLPAEQATYPEPGFRVITTGSLIWRKGLEYSLLAIRELKEMGIAVQYEIIGEGPERDRLLFTIQDLGLQDCVHLAGRLTPEQVRSCLRRADVFLLSSLSEGISNAVLEAMACGLPVVTTDCGGMREALADGVEGFVVPVRSPHALAEKLSLLAANPGMRACMGKAGRERVAGQFSIEDQIDSFEALFSSLLPVSAT